MATRKEARKTGKKEEDTVCPLCFVQECLRDMTERNSAFFKHMNNARIEFLEGIKSLIERQIEAAKKGTVKKKSRGGYLPSLYSGNRLFVGSFAII